MFKNISPRKLSLLAAAIIVISISAVNILLLYVVKSQSIESWLYYTGVSLLIFIVAYVVILYSIRHFIYRKIKLIYKSIRSFRQGSIQKPSTVVDLDDNIFDEVEKEVEAWQMEQESELGAMKALEEYRRDYIGNVAHELKTPIFNIQGYIHTLLDGGLYDSEINMKYLQKASTNIDRLGTILDDLDAINQMESGKMVLEMRDFNLKDLVAEVIGDLEFKAINKNITLGFKDGASTSYDVSADRDSIRQVLVNLIDNSIKYGQEGSRTNVSFYDMDKYVLVEISDNGIGIENKHLKHLFDRFYRIDKGRSRKQGGSGLGLSIVKHIIEAHKETITVRSTKDVGTTFGFTLRKSDD